MISPDTACNEPERLASLCSTHLLDTPEEERFDRITRLAARLFEVPITLVSLVDTRRQWFKSHIGLSVRETPRDISFCGHAILNQNATPLIVEDAHQDSRFHDSPFVTGEPRIRFYAGQPVAAPDGQIIGTLCIIDSRPRTFSAQDRAALSDLAKLVEAEIAKTFLLSREQHREQHLQATNDRLNAHLQNSPLAMIEWDSGFRVQAWSGRAREIFGWSEAQVLTKRIDDWQFVHQEDKKLVAGSMWRLMVGYEKKNTLRNRNWTADGRTVDAVWYNSVLRHPDGSIHSILSLVQDVTAEAEAARELAHSKGQSEATFEQAAIGMSHVGLDGSWLKVNPQMCEITGYSRRELLSMSFRDLIHPDDLKQSDDIAQSLLSSEHANHSLEQRCICKDGAIRWVKVALSLYRDNDGNPVHYIVLINDIQAQKIAETSLLHMQSQLEELVVARTAELRATNKQLTEEVGFRRIAEEQAKDNEQRQAESEERLRTIADNLPVLIGYVNQNERFTFTNATYCDWLGIPADCVVGSSVEDIFGPAQYRQQASYLKRALTGEKVCFESTLTHHGRVRTIENTFLPHRKEDGVAGIYVLSTDVTERKNVEVQQHQLARLDELTGLPNRRSFEERLMESEKRASRSGIPFALMFLDLDHFKDINDTFGHAGGDAALIEFGQRLRASLRMTDYVCRLAGDEFTVILDDVGSPERCIAVAEKILANVTQPYIHAEKKMALSTSIGIALFSNTPCRKALQKAADQALYQAKANGKGRFQIADVSVQEPSVLS